jgi:hypothetical protein
MVALLCVFLAKNLSCCSVLSASVCTSTTVDCRHQKVKEIIPVGRLERKWCHTLENTSKGNSWQEMEKERLQEGRRDWGFVH